MARKANRIWYRAATVGYDALHLDQYGTSVRVERGLTADALPAGIAARADAIRFGPGTNCVEVSI